MRDQEILGLYEAYKQVHQVQEEVEELDEGKSSRPRYPGGRGVLDQERRDEKREASAENMRGHTAGPGTVTKNPKKLRKQKAMGEIGEQVDIYDIILSHLLDEGYAETTEAAEVIMVNMSEEWRQDIMEGMTMKDFKANRQKNKRRAASADAEKRGHVGKEWYNSGRKYSPDEAKRSRANMDDEERRTRHRSAVEPDNESDDNFSADKTKNPKKLRKQRAMGELGEGVDIFDTILEYLVAEGYADTNQAALVIMANMSEEWRESIINESSNEKIAKLKADAEIEKLQGERNKRWAANELKSGSYGVASFARHQEQQKEYEHGDAGLTKAQSRQILSQNRRSLESAAGVKSGSTEKDAWYNDPNYGKNLTGKGKFFSPRTVLAKQGGKEGKLTTDPNTGKKTFTATNWSGSEKSRYSSKGGK